jgi:hypothetical protein
VDRDRVIEKKGLFFMKSIVFGLFKSITHVALVLFVGVLLLFSVSCGGKKEEPPRLGVKILSIAGEIESAAYQKVTEQYAAAHPGLILDATVETVSLDSLVNHPVEALNGTDVLIFPSIATEAFAAHTESFYPISATATTYKEFNYAYQSLNKQWALPITADPIVFVAKRHGFTESLMTGEWLRVKMGSNRAIRSHWPLPHLVFLTEAPLRFTDSVAALQFGFGFARNRIHEKAPRTSLDMGYDTLHLAMKNVTSYITGEDTPLVEIPQIASLEAFAQSEAYLFTFSRLSDYLSLDEAQRKAFVVGPVPTAEIPVVPAYATAASISIESQNPNHAQQFIAFLKENMAVIANDSNTIAADPALCAYSNLYTEETYFILRQNAKTVDQSLILDVFNDKTLTNEANEIWSQGFAIHQL